MIQLPLPTNSARQWLHVGFGQKNKLALCPFRAKPGRGVLGKASHASVDAYRAKRILWVRDL